MGGVDSGYVARSAMNELELYWMCRAKLLESEPWVDPFGFDRLSKYIEMCHGWYPGLQHAQSQEQYIIARPLSRRPLSATEEWAITHCGRPITDEEADAINRFNRHSGAAPGVILRGGDVGCMPAKVKNIGTDGVLGAIYPSEEYTFIKSTPHILIRRSEGVYSHRTITSKGSCYVKATHPMGPMKENWEWFQP